MDNEIAGSMKTAEPTRVQHKVMQQERRRTETNDNNKNQTVFKNMKNNYPSVVISCYKQYICISVSQSFFQSTYAKSYEKKNVSLTA